MRKRLLFITTFIMTIFCFNIIDVKAYSVDDYKNKSLCGTYELAGFHTDGVIDPVGCYSTYSEAKNAMTSNGADDLAIMTLVNGSVKIIDANLALLDLSVNPETLTYFYEQAETNGRTYTYMDTGSLYGGVDGAHIETYYSSSYGWNVKVKIGNFTGWIRQSTYEIVPLTWVKSTSSYTVTSSSIKHNYVNKIQETYSGSRGSTIGPKPDMLDTGTYYSYDGHYFYTDLKTMIKDYKAGNFNNSVNSNNEYYNYYMYLSNHTRTNYSSINIDEYIRNTLGYNGNVYGNAAGSGKSRLYGSGTFFYYAQEKYGVNAVLALSLSRNETANGTSNLAVNKNNGFGLNAVDSSPTESANWYASFSSSILGYASKWITYGYAHPADWRYFGPQFGDKGIGMNVKYASDTYWSEKMAANYYALDAAYGLQDYNYYQLGVVTAPVDAKRTASTSASTVYTYPEAEDALVIIGETEGTSVNGNTKWYKVVSDLNIDSNYNEVTSGDYNWNGYVYVPAAYIKLINEGKNGYISPNEITEYQDANYEYDLLIEDTVLEPKIGYSLENTSYYYDSTLTSKKGTTLLADRYVMIYTIAYDEDKNEVSYLVSSDYWYDQKHWVSADSIKIVGGKYGKSSVTVSAGNYYTWVNSTTVDSESTLISGLYTNTYVPILDEKTVDGYLWYKVPVNLTGTTNQYGWTLASAPDVAITVYTSEAENQVPVINASDLSIVQGTAYDATANVTATDEEDGDLTSSIVVAENNVNIDAVGTYTVRYQVTDSEQVTTEKIIYVTVTENKKPVITANDLETLEGREIDILENVTATDEEDGDLTENITVIKNTIDLATPNTYQVTYQVTDSYNQTTTKTINVVVIDDEHPIIGANDLELTEQEKYDYLKNATATDKEDGDLTDSITIINNTTDINTIGEYELTYQVTDSYNQTTTKTIKVSVVANKAPEIITQDKTIYLNSTFDPMTGVTATDYEDGTITKNIVVISNDVDTTIEGTYTVIYQVTDSFNNTTTKERIITVIEKTLEEKDGLFNLNYLKESDGKILIQGYQTIYGIDNNLDVNIQYTLILVNIETSTELAIKATRITTSSEIPKAVYSPDGKDYTYSWFNAEIDVNDISSGNYKMYVTAQTDTYYSKSLINNKTYKEQATKVIGTEQQATINNNYDTATSFIELKVRDEVLVEKDSSYVYNQYTKYTKFQFNEDNTLYLRGNSYSYGMDLSSNQEVTRNIVFEEKTTYKTYVKELGSITTGNYTVVLPVTDSYNKTRAWFDANIDISDIPVGEYVIYITTSSNISDFSEFTEKLGRNLDDVTTTIDGKTYSFTINKERGNRIELIVTKN